MEDTRKEANGQRPPQSVLVVDDHGMVRGLVVSILESDGLKVLSAANGQAAIDTMNERKHDIGCVLQDLSMPVMSGDKIIVELRQINPQVPILVYSAQEEASAMAYLHGVPITGYLQKPFEPEALISKIRELMPQT